LRWAGSKQRLLRQLVPLLPTTYNTYYEPFLGAGSLFFLLQPLEAQLGDACTELVDTYQAVESDADGILGHLNDFNLLDKELYYAVRAARSTDPIRRAAEFIYLNRAGWNGLYRVNSRGEFNVPYGAPKTSTIVDSVNLSSCATLLARAGIRLFQSDFAVTLSTCAEGDFAFLDPPYVTGHDNNGFIDYNERLFSWSDQVRLASVAKKLAAKGVDVMVTNANHQGVLDLYDGFEAVPISRSSTLAGDKAARRSVTESVLRSYS
jgi:DNA adenine methylase